ncbi:hypothetical protein AB7M49_002363 [Bradyrhizobium elkanii]|uniref:hypothetical protein n=1 Tax=Bradyrhizobium sp. UFLA01-814 TaxID=3023480 RepID=UPI00398B4E6F
MVIRKSSLGSEIGVTTITHKTNLESAEAVICWHLSALGYHQHEIAAVFKVNQRCVHEVLREKKHLGSRQLAQLSMAS